MDCELKPCPFCGGVATDWFCTSNGLYVTKFYNQRLRGLNATHSIVFCNKCGCRTKVYLHMKNAHKSWNRRVDDGKSVHSATQKDDEKPKV